MAISIAAIICGFALAIYALLGIFDPPLVELWTIFKHFALHGEKSFFYKVVPAEDTNLRYILCLAAGLLLLLWGWFKKP